MPHFPLGHRRLLPLLAMAFLWSACLASLPTPGEAADKEAKKDSDKNREAEAGKANGESSYCVVQVGYTAKVLKTADLAAFKKQLQDEFNADLKAYNDAKQEAAKKKLKFAATKPVKLDVKTVAAALKTEDAAKAIRDKTAASLEKKRKKEKEAKAKAREKNGG